MQQHHGAQAVPRRVGKPGGARSQATARQSPVVDATYAATRRPYQVCTSKRSVATSPSLSSTQYAMA